MRTDLKIGMLIGVVIVIITILIISYLPEGSIEERLKTQSLLEQQQQQANEDHLPLPEDDHSADNSGEPDQQEDNFQANPEELQQVLDRLYSQAGQVVEDSGGKTTRDNSRDEIKSPIIRIKAYHTVRDKETLSHISQQYYGTTSKWHLIQEANKDILPNPNLLRIGMRLAIPEE